MIKKLFIATALIFLGIIVILTINTVKNKPKSAEAPLKPAPITNPSQQAAHLAEALKIQTLSSDLENPQTRKNFIELHRFFRNTFPLVHKRLSVSTINDLSLLFTWRGSDPELKPGIVLAHLDTVPADVGTWTHPPFGGVIADNEIWGRGAIDDKGSVVAILEAIEWLLAHNYNPKRTLYFAFGHDEEIGGFRGAKVIAETLEKSNVKAFYIFDEGGISINDLIGNLQRPTALIGVAEKGYLTLELSTTSSGGHSSMPPAKTAINILADALTKLQKNPLPSKLVEPTRSMLMTLAPYSGLLKHAVVSNLWLFEPLLLKLLASDAEMNASIRTTAAATKFSAGTKDNVLPNKATATVNLRLLPGDSVDQVVNKVRKTIADPSVLIRALPAFEPSMVSDTNHPFYKALKKTIEGQQSKVIVTPFLTLGGTDSKHYTKLTKNIFRYLPTLINKDELCRLHGLDERLSIQQFDAMVKFYISLLGTDIEEAG